jgi:hypothetical protein
MATMKRLTLIAAGVLMGALLIQGTLNAQNPPPPPPAKPPAAPAKPAPPPPPPPPPGQGMATAELQNIRLDLRITDTYSGSPVEKTVSMLILNGRAGRVRATNFVPRPGTENTFLSNDPNWNREPIQLHVDAIVNIVSGQKDQVVATVTFEYRPAPPSGGSSSSALPATLNESMHILLQSGKPMLVTQSADPATDRKVTVELTATILR